MGAAYFIGFALAVILLVLLTAGYLVYEIYLGLKFVGRAYRQLRT
jgi:hypothetical protein